MPAQPQHRHTWAAIAGTALRFSKAWAGASGGGGEAAAGPSVTAAIFCAAARPAASNQRPQARRLGAKLLFLDQPRTQ